MNKLSSRKSLRFKLVSWFLFVSILPLVVGMLFIEQRAEKIIKSDMIKLLHSKLEAKEQALQSHFASLGRSLASLANSVATFEASESFADTYDMYVEDFSEIPAEDEIYEANKSFYESTYMRRFKEKTGKDAPQFDVYYEALSENGRAMQYSYVSNSSKISKRDLVSVDDTTAWSEFHGHIHETLRDTMVSFDLADLYIVDPSKSRVIYSVNKDIEFGMDLNTAFLKDTPLKVLSEVGKGLKKGEYFFTDVMRYRPAFELPMQFAVSPIYKSGKMIALLMARMTTSPITGVLTNNDDFESLNLGDEGEVILLNSDGRYLAESRWFKESGSTSDFLRGSSHLKDVERENSVVLNAGIPLSRLGIDGSKGLQFREYKNSLGEKIFASIHGFQLGNVNWVIMAKVPRAYAMDAVMTLITEVLAVLLGAIVAILFIALAIGQKISHRIMCEAKSIQSLMDSSKSDVRILSENTAQVSEGATEQAAAIQETVATLDEISAMIEKSVGNVDNATDGADANYNEAKEGQKVVQDMLNAMRVIEENNEQIRSQVSKSTHEMIGIGELIEEINEKTKVINDIVFQTKLLSFNASVEAARAGEHGKGFAVVAEEVGLLAQMSGAAASEIDEILRSSTSKVEEIVVQTEKDVSESIKKGVSSVEEGVSVANRCNAILHKVVNNASHMKGLLGEISMASKEQSLGVGNIAEAMSKLDRVINANTESSRKSNELVQEFVLHSNGIADAVTMLENFVQGEVRSDSSSMIKIEHSDYQKSTKSSPVKRSPAILKPSKLNGDRSSRVNKQVEKKMAMKKMVQKSENSQPSKIKKISGSSKKLKTAKKERSKDTRLVKVERRSLASREAEQKKVVPLDVKKTTPLEKVEIAKIKKVANSSRGVEEHNFPDHDDPRFEEI